MQLLHSSTLIFNHIRILHQLNNKASIQNIQRTKVDGNSGYGKKVLIHKLAIMLLTKYLVNHKLLTSSLYRNNTMLSGLIKNKRNPITKSKYHNTFHLC
jgi:hypothetical protein